MQISRSSYLAVIVYTFGLLIGYMFFIIPILGYPLKYFPGDLGDGRLVLYFLEHAHRFFTFQVSSFWDAPFMYPEKNVIAYSESLLGSAPFYSLFRLFGFDIYEAYQFWVISMVVLNYTTAFLLLKKIFRNSYVAVLGAMVFAFSLALQSQMTHAQTFPRFAIPLTILALLYFKDSLQPKHFFLALLFLVYQVYCGIYLGFMLFVPVAAFLAISLAGKTNKVKELWKKAKWRYQMLGAMIVNIILLIPLLLPYMERARSANIHHFRSIFPALPSVKSYFFSHKGSLFWDFLSDTAKEYPAWWNHQIFPGGVATIAMIFLVGFIIYKLVKKDPKYKLGYGNDYSYLFMTFAATKLLYLRVGFISLYIVIYFLPGFSAIRSLARIINIELIFYAIATSFLFSFIIKRENWKSLVLFLVFLSIIVVDNFTHPENIYKTPVDEAKARTVPLIKTMKQFPIGAVVSYEPEPAKGGQVNYHIDAMLASQKFDIKVINAYTGNSPFEYSHFWHNINSTNRNVWLAEHDLKEDSIYIIKSSSNFYGISVSEIDFNVTPVKRTGITKEQIEEQIVIIKRDSAWMKHIREKAKEQSRSIDSIIRMDAEWVLRH